VNTIIKTDVVEMVHSGRNAPYGAKRIAKHPPVGAHAPIVAILIQSAKAIVSPVDGGIGPMADQKLILPRD